MQLLTLSLVEDLLSLSNSNVDYGLTQSENDENPGETISGTIEMNFNDFRDFISSSPILSERAMVYPRRVELTHRTRFDGYWVDFVLVVSPANLLSCQWVLSVSSVEVFTSLKRYTLPTLSMARMVDTAFMESSLNQ